MTSISVSELRFIRDYSCNIFFFFLRWRCKSIKIESALKNASFMLEKSLKSTACNTNTLTENALHTNVFNHVFTEVWHEVDEVCIIVENNGQESRVMYQFFFIRYEAVNSKNKIEIFRKLLSIDKRLLIRLFIIIEGTVHAVINCCTLVLCELNNATPLADFLFFWNCALVTLERKTKIQGLLKIKTIDGGVSWTSFHNGKLCETLPIHFGVTGFALFWYFQPVHAKSSSPFSVYGPLLD